MMNYHCQWEDSPHLIVCEEMNQRLQILLQCEAELLKDLMAKDGVITDWKEVGLRSLLNTFDQLIFTQFSLQFDSIMDRFRLELLGFEEELQEVLPPNPILYCPSSKGQSTPQFDIQQPIAEYLQQIDQVIEMELLRCPLLDFFEGVNPENVLNNFIPCLSGILTKSADSCSLKTTISSHCSSGGDNNNTNDDKHIERNDPKNVESFELLKKRIQFLQQCRERFQDYLTKLKISLREKMFERTNSTLFASTQNRSRKSFHQLHRFPALIAYLKHDVMDKFIEQNFPELITEIMQYFDWTMMQLEAEGKLTLFKLTVELSEQFTFLTKQSVLKQWMQLLEAFKSSNAKYMVDHSHIRMLLEEQVGYRKTREQCYYRLYSWHLQLQSLRSLHHYLNEINVITTGMAFEQLKDIQQEEIRQLLNKAIRKRKSKLHDFQRRWNASAMVIEEWEPDFWEIAWRKFHNLPAEDIKISSSRSDTDDETMEVSNSKLKDGERKETKEIKINPSKILVGDLQMSLAKQMNVSNYSPQGYNSSKKPRLI